MCPERAPELLQYYNWEAAHAKCEIVNLISGKVHLVPEDMDIFEEDWERMKKGVRLSRQMKELPSFSGMSLILRNSRYKWLVIYQNMSIGLTPILNCEGQKTL